MNYTSIEQSKKLLELGLKAETADACYDVGYGQTKAHIECENFISYFTNDEFPELKDRYIPCWSLGALLEVLPNGCSVNKVDDHYEATYLIHDECGCYTCTTPVDAIYTMLCYFLKDKMYFMLNYFS